VIPFTKLHSTDRQNLRDVLPLDKPFTVLIEPSSLCNFKCSQCFQSIKAESYFSKNRMNMPMARFCRVIKQLRAWEGPQVKVLKLSLYGEPMMNPEFCEMVRIAKDSKTAERIETTSNVSMLSRSISEKLVEYQLDYMRVSIYSPDQKRHAAITGSEVDIRAIHDNLRVLSEVKRLRGSQRPFVSCKMLDSFGPENDRFVAMYQDVADEVYIDKPHSWIRTGDADFMKNYYQDDIGAAEDDFRRHRTQRIACPMAFTTMAVRSNGDVSPCCVDFIGGTNLDNVDGGSLQAIWRSGRWLEFQKMQLQNRKHENSSCTRCDFSLSDHYTKDDIDGFAVEKLLKSVPEKQGRVSDAC
jgi:radical SAM protein with 4Fe4S-binding SPASM domain